MANKNFFGYKAAMGAFLVISGIVMLFVGNVFARTGPSFFFNYNCCGFHPRKHPNVCVCR